MSSTKILLLIMLLKFGVIVSPVQAETIRGMEIPNINKTLACGKWYVTNGPGMNEDVQCIVLNITQPSAASVVLTLNVTLSYETMKNNRTLNNTPIVAPWTCTTQNSSNILICENDFNLALILVVFQAVYDSYMAISLSYAMGEIAEGTNGVIYILSREPTLRDGVMEKVQQSIFYRQQTSIDQALLNSRAIGC